MKDRKGGAASQAGQSRGKTMRRVKGFLSVFSLCLWVASSPLLAATIAQWRMDEPVWDGSAGEVADSLGGFNGRARTAGSDGSLPSTVEAQVCRGGLFRGQGFNDPERGGAYVDAQHYAEVPSATALSPLAQSGEISLSGWIRPDTNGDLTIIHKGQGGQSQEYQVAVVSGELTLTFWNVFGSPFEFSLDSVTLVPGSWYYFGASGTREAKGNSGNARLHGDLFLFSQTGVLLSSVRETDNDFFNKNEPYAVKNLTSPLLVGGERFGAGSDPVNFFNGVIDELQLTNTALTQADFEALLAVSRACDTGAPFPVSDNFESYPLDSVAGGSDGIGWGDNAWEAAAGQRIIDTSANPLIFQDSLGRSIRSQTSLEISGNNNKMAFRKLDGTFSGERVFLSMLVRFQGTRDVNDFLAFWIQEPNFGDSPQFGIKTREGTPSGNRDFFVRLDENAAYSTRLQPGQTYLLVAEFEKDNAGFFNQGRLWVDPECDATPPATPSAEIILNPAKTVSEIKEIGFRSANLDADDSVEIGQLAAGETWPDVVNCSPGPLVTYSMEEAGGWTGAAGEVLDSSGNNLHATALNGAMTAQSTPAIPGNPGTCRYGMFTRANKDYIALPSNFPNLGENGEAFTITAWIRTDNSASPGQRIFIDDENNSNGFGLSLGDGGAGRLRFYSRGTGSQISLDTGDVIANDSWYFVAAVADVPSKIKWIYVFDNTGNLLTSVSNAPWSAPSFGSDSGIASIGGETNAPGENTGNFSFSGNIDEINVFTSALSETDLRAERARTYPCSTVLAPDHIRLEHNGFGLTCSHAEVNVIACADAQCSTRFADPVQVELTSPSGNWSPNPITVNPKDTAALWYSTPGLVTLNAVATAPVAQNATRCFIGGTETCDMNFVESAFLLDIPDHVADTSVNASIAAVRADPNDPQQCVPGFENVEKKVDLWSDYLNPATGTQKVLMDNTELPLVSDSGLTRALSFDANGIATFPLRYPDVGEIQLNARYEGSDPNEPDADLIMEGEGRFISRPNHFTLTIPNNPAATTVLDGNAFTAAGADFEVQVAAHNRNDAITPNFGRESDPESVTLTAALVAPVGGNAPPLAGAFGLFGKDCQNNPAPGGTACGLFQWPEVGIISLLPTLTSGVYLGTEAVSGNEVSHVGRFIPAQLRVEVIDGGSLAPTCDTFAYSGQPLNWMLGLEPMLEITALNAGGTEETKNYTLGNFQRLGASDITREVPAEDVDTLDTEGNPYALSDVQQQALAPFGVAVDGVMQFRFATNDQLTYQKSPDTRVNPFIPKLLFRITAVNDKDAVPGTDLADETITAMAPLTFVPQAHNDFELRYGRLRLENAFGPETQDLVIPMQVQFWNEGFQLNLDESCWSYNTADVTLDPTLTAAVLVEDTLLTGEPMLGSELILIAPGADNTGKVGVEFTVPIWLQDDFTGAGTLQNPRASATFGVFRGHDRIIYWREMN